MEVKVETCSGFSFMQERGENCVAGKKDDFDFVERFTKLKQELESQIEEEVKLNKTILHNLTRIIGVNNGKK